MTFIKVAIGVLSGTLSGRRTGGAGRALIRTHKPDVLVELAATSDAHYAWRVTLPDTPTFEVRILPVQTQAGVEALYPDAIVEPVPETVH